MSATTTAPAATSPALAHMGTMVGISAHMGATRNATVYRDAVMSAERIAAAARNLEGILPAAALGPVGDLWDEAAALYRRAASYSAGTAYFTAVMMADAMRISAANASRCWAAAREA